jgi:4'-phosphopantetheinyl transferase
VRQQGASDVDFEQVLSYPVNPVDPAGKGYTLKPGQVQVWFAMLDRGAPEIAALVRVLSPEEMDRANRFRRSVDRERYLARRGLLRRRLSQYLRLGPEKIEIHRHSQGKPYVPARINPDNLQFSESDSDNLAAFAFSRSSPIGVDIEKIRAFPDMPALVERYFTARERREVLCGHKAQRLIRFYRLWTRKEAVLKAQGEGLLKGLDSVDVSAGHGSGPWPVQPRDRGVEGEYHHMNIDAPAGFCSAIAVADCLTDISIYWDLV